MNRTIPYLIVFLVVTALQAGIPSAQPPTPMQEEDFDDEYEEDDDVLILEEDVDDACDPHN